MIEWLSVKDITEKYGLKPTTITKYRKEMEESGLFQNYILSAHKLLRIEEGALIYFLRNIQKIRNGERVPKYKGVAM